MKLTKRQEDVLLNQHTGTGYLYIKNADKGYCIMDVWLGRDGDWYTGNSTKLEKALIIEAEDIEKLNTL